MKRPMSPRQIARLGGKSNIAKHGRTKATEAMRAAAESALDQRLRAQWSEARGHDLTDEEWAEIRTHARSIHFSRIRRGSGRRQKARAS